MVGIETTESRRAAASWAQRTRLATSAAVSLTLFATASTGRADVLMQRYDKGRTGATVDANISPSSFSDGKWQRLKVLSVDGAVYAQPLFLQNKLMSDGVVHDVVYIATARNKLYAFDADTFQLIWQKQPLIPGTQDLAVADISDELIPGELGALAACAEMSPTHLPANGDTSASAADYGIGIQSTPVLDPTAGTNGYMYFAFRSNLGSGWATSKQYIAKMDLKTGTITSKEITPSNLEGQPVSAVRQRASLLLNDGIIYVAFASHCEERSEDDPDFTYHGILLAIDAGTLNVVEHFDTVEPGVIGGGIWQASSGIAADDNDNLFFMTGNALPTTLEETSTTNMPNAFVKVHATNSGGSVTFSNVDFFRPWRAVWQDKIDLDLGAAGVLLPPGSNQVVGGGKEGILYVLNRNNLGQLASGAWDEQDIPACAGTLPNLLNLCEPTCSTSVYPDSENAENVVQKWPAAVNMDCTTPHMNTWLAWPHIHGTPVYGTVAGTDYLYMWAERGQIKAWRRKPTDPTKFEHDQPYVGEATAANEGMPGGMLTLTTNAAHTSGVLFAAVPQQKHPARMRGALLAFDATPVEVDGVRTLRQLWGDYELVDPDDDVTRDPYFHAKFVPPTIADGKVFLATFSNKVNVYGRKPTMVPTASAHTNIGSLQYKANSVVSMLVQPDGRVRVFGENDNGAWQSYGTLGSVNQFPVDAPIALYKQTSARTIALVVGNDDKLHVFRTDASTITSGTSWTHSIINAATSMPPGAPIAIRHRGSEVSAFLVDADGDMHRYWVTGSDTSWSNQKLSAGTTFPIKAHVASDYQYSGFFSTWLDVFAVDESRDLWVFAANNSAGAAFSASAVPNTDYEPGAHIATGHQAPDIINVFIIGGTRGDEIDPDNWGCSGAYNNCSGQNDVSQAGALNVITAVGFGAPTVRSIKRFSRAPGMPGGPVVAINQGSNQLDVFFVGQNGIVQYYGVQGTGHGWFNGELELNATPGAPIAAVAQTMSGGYPNQIDLLVPETHGIFGTFLVSGFWMPSVKFL